MGERYLRCPACRTTDDLVLTETLEEHGVTDPGRHVLDGGNVIPSGDFWFSPGDPVRVMAECTSCGHVWRVRKSIGTRSKP